MESGCEVVVTGWDVVSPLGVGKAPFVQAFESGASGVRRQAWLDATPFPVKFGGDVPDFDGKKFVQPRKAMKVMSREIQLGYAASMLAAADAGVSAGTVHTDRLGVVFASEMLYPEVDELVDAYRACLQEGRFEFADWGKKGFPRLYPLWLLKYLPNMVACHVGIALEARGPNNSVVCGEISSLLAVQEAYHLIRRDLADVVLVGGIGSRLNVTPLIYRSPQPLSRLNDAPHAACRPFDLRRDGVVNGEGAAAIVLERRAHAEARGARIVGRILGGASSGDRHGVADPAPAIRRSIQLALRSAGLAPTDVGHVNAHGLSCPQHDVAEAQAIRQELGDVLVTAPKSYFGHLGAGGGLVELCASLSAFEKGAVPPTLNCDDVDPACPIQVVRGKAAPLGRPVALALNQTSGGQTAALALARD